MVFDLNRPKSLLEGGACADTFTLIAVPVVFHQAPLARFSCEALGCLMPRWSVRSHASRRMLRRSGRRGGPMILEAGTQQPGEHTLEGVGDQAVCSDGCIISTICGGGNARRHFGHEISERQCGIPKPDRDNMRFLPTGLSYNYVQLVLLVVPCLCVLKCPFLFRDAFAGFLSSCVLHELFLRIWRCVLTDA